MKLPGVQSGVFSVCRYWFALARSLAANAASQVSVFR